MKIHFIFRLVFSIALVTNFCVINAVSYTHSTIPGGSYHQSCNNVTMETKTNGSNIYRVVAAYCQDSNGNLKKASITLPVYTEYYLDVTLDNIDGTLRSFQPQL